MHSLWTVFGREKLRAGQSTPEALGLCAQPWSGLTSSGFHPGLCFLLPAPSPSDYAGRSLSLLDPTYASKYIPIIASVSEHQPPTWSSYFTDINVMVSTCTRPSLMLLSCMCVLIHALQRCELAGHMSLVSPPS